MTSNIYCSFYSLDNYMTLERNFYFCFIFNNHFCCSSYSLNLANIAPDPLISSHWLWYQFHIIYFIYHIALIFLERWVFFQKLIQPCFIMSSVMYAWNIWILTIFCEFVNRVMCFFVCSLFVYSRLLFMLLNWITNSFCSYH